MQCLQDQHLDPVFISIDDMNMEREQTINQILVVMDGFDAIPCIITLAARNRADILDKGMLRPSQFYRNISVHLPGKNHFRKLLKLNPDKSSNGSRR